VKENPFPPLEEEIEEVLLFGPGPTNLHPRVQTALSQPILGHLDPKVSSLLSRIQDGLRILFGTQNRVTFPVSGTGSCGMEFLVSNCIEPGERVVVGIYGIFGERIAQAVKKMGGEVLPLYAPYGEGIHPDDLEKLLKTSPPVKVVFLVHAETSTGYRLLHLSEIGKITRRYGAFFFLDTVTSLGGIPVDLDIHGISATFSATQKCLGVPPGLAPVSLCEEVVKKVLHRRYPIPSWYLDLSYLLSYWEGEGGVRLYHHTAPVTNLFSLYEGIRILLEEGISSVYRRYEESARILEEALTGMGFRYCVQDRSSRLPMLHAVYPPKGVEADTLRMQLRKVGVEVGGGLGNWKGKVIRIGLMGINADPKRVELFLNRLQSVLSTRV
jgi:alanine-glyoxylate transaminase/serine-glyoxylate transaminase/serine-pyruvate transaminase